MDKVLITGGTGMIGKEISKTLSRLGYEIRILTTRKEKANGKDTFYWDYKRQVIDSKALNDIQHIVHLAGTNIGAGRWTKKRKEEIITSRVDSIKFLKHCLDKENIKPETLISAGGVNYYGTVTSQHIYNEEDKPGSDFLANVCLQWEKSALDFRETGIRVVIFRMAMVLSAQGGGLQRLYGLTNKGLGTAVGAGKQFMPWIHMEDLINLYVFALKNKNMQGAYNAVAPEHVTNERFMQLLAESLNKKLWLPNAPSFMIKLLLGEMSGIILKGSRISSEKIQKQGFKFTYPECRKAMKNLMISHEPPN